MTSRDNKRRRAFRAISRTAARRFQRDNIREFSEREFRASHAALARQRKKLKAKRRAEIAASIRSKLRQAQKCADSKDDYGARLLRRKGSVAADVDLEFGSEMAGSGLIGAALADIEAGRITPHQNAVAEVNAVIDNTRNQKSPSQHRADDAELDAQIEALRDPKRRITKISLIKKAEEVFLTRKEALRRLREPAMALNYQKPRDLMKTREGRRRVETLLGQLEYGVYI
jgi:hypothetical protein